MDQAQFFWLIAYFLGFATILKLDIGHLKNVLDIEILSYLTWGVIRESEALDGNTTRLVNKESSVRRLHRGVTAIREFLQMLKIYSHTDSDESRGFEEWSRQLHSYTCRQ
jgi:timeless protein